MIYRVGDLLCRVYRERQYIYQVTAVRGTRVEMEVLLPGHSTSLFAFQIDASRIVPNRLKPLPLGRIVVVSRVDSQFNPLLVPKTTVRAS
jgi:hypothetical protein